LISGSIEKCGIDTTEIRRIAPPSFRWWKVNAQPFEPGIWLLVRIVG
jgi:hypothetical protein